MISCRFPHDSRKRQKYKTNLSVENIQVKLKKITTRESKLEDDPVFFIGSINYDNFQIEPDYMDRSRLSVPKLYGTYLSNNQETVVSVKIEYRYAIIKFVGLFILEYIIVYGKGHYNYYLTFERLKHLGFLILFMTIVDGILFTISSYKMLSTLKIFIAAKKIS